MNKLRQIMIRPFREEYREQVISLIEGCFRELDWELDLEAKDFDLNDIPARYQHHTGQFWVLWIDDHIQGCIALQKHDKVFHLRRFYIHKDYRNQGLGTMLIRHLLEHAALHDIHDIRLSTKARHSAAYHIFEKAGFSPIEDSDLGLRCHIFMKRQT